MSEARRRSKAGEKNKKYCYYYTEKKTHTHTHVDFLSVSNGRKTVEYFDVTEKKPKIGDVSASCLVAGDEGEVVGIQNNICVKIDRTGFCHDLPPEVLDSADAKVEGTNTIKPSFASFLSF